MGRSNVGKSTLLNALLYNGVKGNLQNEGGENEEKEEEGKGGKGGRSKDNRGYRATRFTRGKGVVKSAPLPAPPLSPTVVGVPSPVWSLPKGSKALVSPTPGSTSGMSYYRMTSKDGDRGITIVDMPGYGYADNGRLYGGDTREYVLGGGCKGVVWLVDGRHGFKDVDRMWIRDMEVRRREGEERERSEDFGVC